MSTEHTNENGHRKSAFIRQRHLARALAMQFIYQADSKNEWLFDEDSFNAFLDTAIDSCEEANEAPLQSDIEAAAPFAKQLTQGTIQNKAELDAAIENASKNWALYRMKMTDRAIMRMAAYEIIHEAKVSAATTINEAIELAKAYGDGDSPRFVNGVLDKIRAAYGKQSKNSQGDAK